MSFYSDFKNNSKDVNNQAYETKCDSNRTEYYRPKLEDDLVRRVKSQSGIGNTLILFCHESDSPYAIIKFSAGKCQYSVTMKEISQRNPDHFQLKIDNVVISETLGDTVLDVKKELSELALVKLQMVCFTVVKKTRPKDLPKVVLSTTNQSNFVIGGIGAKIMQKMGWSGKGLGIQEQGRTDIVKPYFHVKRRGFGTHNIMAEIWFVLKNYSDSQDYNSIAFSPEFTKEERAAIHVIAKKLNLQARSFGKDQERFLVVENKIKPWDLVSSLLEAGGENEQYKIIIPTKFL